MGDPKETRRAAEDDGESPEHTETDALIIEALAEGQSRRHAGQLGGVSERTVFRKLEDPEFEARVARRRDELNTARLAAHRALYTSRIGFAQRADQALAELLEHDEPSVRLAAAKQLNHGLHGASQLDTELRLIELERQHAQAQAGSATNAGWPG